MECEACGNFGPDVERQPHGVICIVEIADLDPIIRERFLEVWETDGEAGDCPCAENRECSNCGNDNHDFNECSLSPDEVSYEGGICTRWVPDF